MSDHGKMTEGRGWWYCTRFQNCWV